MSKSDKPLRCYIAGFNNSRLDPFLESRGFSRGMVCFAIPAYGILFRCRTEGRVVDLEFGAIFSLLEFINTKLKDEKIKSVQIYSSNPEAVFAFTENSPHMREGSPRRLLLNGYAKKMKIAVGYVKPNDNRALISPAEYPSLPADKSVALHIDSRDLKRVEFKPFQTGVKVRR